MHSGVCSIHFIRQVQSGPAVTTIHQNCDLDISFHGFDQNIEDVIIYNVSASLEINRNQCLIITISFVL